MPPFRLDDGPRGGRTPPPVPRPQPPTAEPRASALASFGVGGEEEPVALQLVRRPHRRFSAFREGAPKLSRDNPVMTNGAEEEDAASAQPTEPAAAVEPTEPPPPPDDSAAPSGPPPTRGGWLVPKWAIVALVGFVAVALLFGSAFAIGRATAPGGDDHERIERGFGGRPGRGEGPQLPPQASGVFLGVSTQRATGDQQGAEVQNVASGSPAAGAGLEQGDVITAVDGTAVSTPADLARLVRSHHPGDQVTITYTRGGNSTDTQVQLGDRSAQDAPAQDAPPS
jgi:membrane-associated protease RseP (regulator of RpoE activity)